MKISLEFFHLQNQDKRETQDRTKNNRLALFDKMTEKKTHVRHEFAVIL